MASARRITAKNVTKLRTRKKPTIVSVPQSQGLPPRPRAKATIPPVAAIRRMITSIFAPVASDDDGFLVFAEDVAEGVGDFAYGGVGFDGGEDGGEEIFRGGGTALEFG